MNGRCENCGGEIIKSYNADIEYCIVCGWADLKESEDEATYIG
jgi:ribosomal protein L37E